eukprot:gene29138-32356_t
MAPSVSSTLALCAAICALLLTAAPVQASLVLSATDYQLRLSSGGSYCTTSINNGFAFVTCGLSTPPAFTSFSMMTPPGANPLVVGEFGGQPFNLAFRPGSSFPQARLAFTSDGLGVVMGSSNSMKDPFGIPGSRPMMPPGLLPAKFVWEKADTLSTEGSALGWGDAGADGLLLKAVSAADAALIGGLTSLLVCDPGLSAAIAPRFKIAPAGSIGGLGMSLLSKKTNTFCGLNAENAVVCTAGFNKCCVAPELPGAVFWNYVYGPDSVGELFSDTVDFSMQAWNSILRIPVRVMTLWGTEVLALPPTDGMTPALFRIVHYSTPDGGTDDVTLESGMDVLLYSVDLDLFCSPDSVNKLTDDTRGTHTEVLAHVAETRGSPYALRVWTRLYDRI